MRLLNSTLKTLKWTAIAFWAVAVAACGEASSPQSETKPKAVEKFVPSEPLSAECESALARYKELYPEVDDSTYHVVLTHKYKFCPAQLTIKVGETVRWINVDKRTSHSVWLQEAGVEESERMFPEESWSYTFDKEGEYPYLCGPHGERDGMVATLTVTK